MREYLLVALIAVGVTYLLSGLARRLAFRYNAVAMVRDRDVHTKPVPYFGGVAMWFGLAAAFLVASQLPWLGSFEVVRHDATAVLVAGGLICLVGAVDDVVELGAVAKIAGVTNVVNNIQDLNSNAADDHIRRQMLRTLGPQPVIGGLLQEPNPSVRIIVENGKVSLEGWVANKSQKDTIYILASGVPGVFKVTNDLRVGKPESV